MLSDPNRSDFESQIASDCDRSSKKFTATPKTPILSGTESAILNRESGDSESCDSNRAIPRSR